MIHFTNTLLPWFSPAIRNVFCPFAHGVHFQRQDYKCYNRGMFYLEPGTNFYLLPITYYSTHGFLYNLLLATDYLLFRAYRWNFNEEPFILVFIKLKTLKQPWATQPCNTSICHFPQLSTTIHNHNNPQLRTITSSYNLVKQITIDHVFVWGAGARRIRGNIDLRTCLFMSHPVHYIVVVLLLCGGCVFFK